MLDDLPQFMSAPTSCQFAKDGAWEDAWSFPSGRLPSHSELVSYLAQSTEVAFEAFFGVFRQELGCPLPGQPPAFAEIGCVNAWRSVGAVRISEPHLASSGFARLWHSVLHSSVGRDTRHAKAIEFAFEYPLAHWFGVPVSVTGESNSVSEALLRQATGLVASPEPQPARHAP